MSNDDIAREIRRAAGRAALDAFDQHAAGKAQLDLAVLHEIKVAGREPDLRTELHTRLLAHYTSPAGRAEIEKAPPQLRDLPPERIVERLMDEFPQK